MLYSEVIAWHGIDLDPDDQKLANVYFTGLAHHAWRWKETYEGSPEESFHAFWQRQHATALLALIFHRGRFVRPDPSEEERDRRCWWDPIWGEIPDDDFSKMYADCRFPVGCAHPNDHWLVPNQLRKVG